jgi:hypothetical protein
VLTPQLAERLKADAKRRGHGLSTEIRLRLEQTYYDQRGEPLDPPTNDLNDKINWLASNLARRFGTKWHQHPYVLAAFRAGVEFFLAQSQPEGDENTPPDTVGFFGHKHPKDPPAAFFGRADAEFIIMSKNAQLMTRAVK